MTSIELDRMVWCSVSLCHKSVAHVESEGFELSAAPAFSIPPFLSWLEKKKKSNTIINNATDAVKQVERQKRGMISHDADIASSFPLSIGKLSKLHSPKRTGYGKRGSWGGEMIVVFFLECDEGERCVSSHWAPSWRGHRGFIFFFF